MQNLFNWFVNDVAVWLIAGFASVKFINGVKEQKIGQAIMAIVIGGGAYYFAKNPVTVLNFVSDIWAKMFGG